MQAEFDISSLAALESLSDHHRFLLMASFYKPPAEKYVFKVKKLVCCVGE